MATLIRNGTIVTASDQYKADLLINGEKIAAVGSALEGRAEVSIDATGKYILPGGVDGHVHLGQMSSRGTAVTGYETTPAALAGGTTTVIGFAPQTDGLGLLDSVIKLKEEKADGKSAVDYGLHAGVRNPGKDVFEEVPSLVRAGVSTVKLLMTLTGTAFHCDDATIFQMLQQTRKAGVLTMVHAENGDVIDVLQKQLIADNRKEPKYHAISHPTVTEEEATRRATLLAKAADAPVLIVHVSCCEAMMAVREARDNRIHAFGEACPQYLTLSVDRLSLANFEGAKYVCSPPLREAWHQDRLWAGLRQGVLQIVGSDHCAFNFKGQKEMGRENFVKIPNGLPGMEHRLALLYTYGVLRGKLSLTRMVDVFATTPAKLYGLYPQKGSIAVGADADIVIFDPSYKGEISVTTSLQDVDYTPYEGFEQRGRPEKVLLRGKLSFDNGKFVGELGQGRFIHREPYGLAYASADATAPRAG
jgi:dihydropyrimidinase